MREKKTPTHLSFEVNREYHPSHEKRTTIYICKENNSHQKKRNVPFTACQRLGFKHSTIQSLRQAFSFSSSSLWVVPVKEDKAYFPNENET